MQKKKFGIIIFPGTWSDKDCYYAINNILNNEARYIWHKETNIDDMNPEILAYVQERLFALGALDVWISSIAMKKNRLGSMLSVLVSTEHENEAVKLIMKETSSFGVRVRPVAR